MSRNLGNDAVSPVVLGSRCPQCLKITNPNHISPTEVN
jgi:hypothetical protein